MSYTVGYPINFVANGDTTSQAIAKFINEFNRLYGYLNTEAAKIPSGASGLPVTDAGNYFTAENVETILQEVGAVIAGLGDLATKDAVADGDFAFTDVTTGNATASAHGLLPKLSGNAAQCLLGNGTWGSGAGQYIKVEDIKTSGTAGGSATADAWRSRAFNTIVTDETGAVSLSSGRIVLPAGTYVFRIDSVGYACGMMMNRLYNVTASEVIATGLSSPEGSNEVGAYPSVAGKFTVSVSTTVQLQTYNTYSNTTDGYGYPLSITGQDERYITAQFWKVG